MKTEFDSLVGLYMTNEEFIQEARKRLIERAEKKQIVVDSPEWYKMVAMFVINEAPRLAKEVDYNGDLLPKKGKFPVRRSSVNGDALHS